MGTVTESREATAASWPFFVAGPLTETSPPTVRKERKRKVCVLDFLVAEAAREEEREKAAAERSE